MRLLRSTFFWKAFIIYIVLSSIIHAALGGTNVSVLVFMTLINILYGVLGWFIPGILLNRKNLSLPVTISLWLSPIILLAVFTLIYSYVDAEIPLILYISASILSQVRPEIQKPKSSQFKEWARIFTCSVVILIIDLLLTGLYGVLVGNSMNRIR